MPCPLTIRHHFGHGMPCPYGRQSPQCHEHGSALRRMRPIPHGENGRVWPASIVTPYARPCSTPFSRSQFYRTEKFGSVCRPSKNMPLPGNNHIPITVWTGDDDSFRCLPTNVDLPGYCRGNKGGAAFLEKTNSLFGRRTEKINFFVSAATASTIANCSSSGGTGK